jgi:choline dehydrogenase-like flavoprotein
LKILVIEAGEEALSEDRINIPGRKGSTLGTKYDWNFTTVAQPGAGGRVLAQNRGKVLGGTSALNLLTYDRASEHEYNGWEEVGNPGWGWNSFVTKMQRSENFTSANSQFYTGSEDVGTTGPIRGTINRFIPSHQDAWIPTVKSLGIPENKHSFNGDLLGVFYSPSSINPTHYTRSYSASEYLPLAGSNLKVMTQTRVAKVNLEKSGMSYKATGVTLQDGTVFKAKKEVILSCGSFQSPGMLEASGIGRADVLSAANITKLIELPGVGENLQDHIRIQSSYQLKDNYTSFDILRYNQTFAAQQLQLWRDDQFSMYDYTGSAYTFMNWAQAGNDSAALLAAAQAAVGTSTAPADVKHLAWLSDPTVPQLEVIMSDGYTGVKGYPAPGAPLYGKGFFSLLAAVMHPLSRGSVHINPADPLGKPIINPNYLSNDYDLKAAIAGIKMCRRIAQTAPLADVWVSEYEPGLDTVNTDEEWRAYALANTLSIYHPVGTCAMLSKAKGGVVDSKLKVYGTTNLRVVDASVIPVLISAHIQTSVYGIAEMAADIIVAA